MGYFSLYGNWTFACAFVLAMFAALKSAFNTADRKDFFIVAEFVCVLAMACAAGWEISQRSLDTIGDTETYTIYYNGLLLGIPSPLGTFEPAFTLLARILAAGKSPIAWLFFVAPLLLIFAYHHLSTILFGRRNSLALWSVLLLISFPFFLSLTANVIRQGIAMAFILWTISSIIEGRRKMSFAWALGSVVFHRSSLLILPFVALGQRIADVSFRIILTVWGGVTLASYFQIFQKLSGLLFGFLASHGLSVDYSSVSAAQYLTGFRLDFWVFSSLPLVFLAILILWRDDNRGAQILFKVACYFSILHIALFSIAYNDRFGIYAWILYPIQGIYLLNAGVDKTQSVLSRLNPAHKYEDENDR